MNLSPIKKQITYILVVASSVFVGGCDLINPIRQLDCKATKSWGSNPAKEAIFILNVKTGDFYATDDFSNKLQLLNGKTVLEGDTYHTRANLSGNLWKAEVITVYAPRFPYPYKNTKQYSEVNLKSMEYKIVENIQSDSNEWDTLWGSEGKCKWGKPKTTEILKRE